MRCSALRTRIARTSARGGAFTGASGTPAMVWCLACRRHASQSNPQMSSSQNLRAPYSLDRKSTRLNSSHSQISYAVFCLKKKHNMLESQFNLRDAINRTITFDDPNTGKQYELNEDVAVVIARPRGSHLFYENIISD